MLTYFYIVRTSLTTATAPTTTTSTRFAIVNEGSSRNYIRGNGSKPDGRSDISPVANIKTFSTDTAAWPPARGKGLDTPW